MWFSHAELILGPVVLTLTIELLPTWHKKRPELPTNVTENETIARFENEGGMSGKQ